VAGGWLRVVNNFLTFSTAVKFFTAKSKILFWHVIVEPFSGPIHRALRGMNHEGTKTESFYENEIFMEFTLSIIIGSM
jgi:hypothetical protein